MQMTETGSMLWEFWPCSGHQFGLRRISEHLLALLLRTKGILMSLHTRDADILCNQQCPNHGLLRITSAVNAKVVILYTLYAFFSADLKLPFLKETGNALSTSLVSGTWPEEFDDNCRSDENCGGQ